MDGRQDLWCLRATGSAASRRPSFLAVFLVAREEFDLGHAWCSDGRRPVGDIIVAWSTGHGGRLVSSASEPTSPEQTYDRSALGRSDDACGLAWAATGPQAWRGSFLFRGDQRQKHGGERRPAQVAPAVGRRVYIFTCFYPTLK